MQRFWARGGSGHSHLAAEQLCVERDDDRAKPDNDEDAGEDREGLVGGSCAEDVICAEERGQNSLDPDPNSSLARTIGREEDSESQAELRSEEQCQQCC